MWLLEAAIVPLFLGAFLAYTAGEPYAQFTSGVNLVEVYATVTDRHGEPVAGLRAADFKITEDGSTQAITAFAAGEFPLAIAIGLDRSFSMGGKDNRLGVVKSAGRTLVGALRPGDQVLVVAIGGETAIVAPLSTDRAAALSAIDRLDAWAPRRSTTQRLARSTRFSRRADAARSCCCRMAPIATARPQRRTSSTARGNTMC